MIIIHMCVSWVSSPKYEHFHYELVCDFTLTVHKIINISTNKLLTLVLHHVCFACFWFVCLVGWLSCHLFDCFKKLKMLSKNLFVQTGQKREHIFIKSWLDKQKAKKADIWQGNEEGCEWTLCLFVWIMIVIQCVLICIECSRIVTEVCCAYGWFKFLCSFCLFVFF